MKKLLFLVFLAFTGAAFGQKDLVVDANASVRPIPGTFNAIKVSGGIDLYLSQSGEEAMAVSASEEKYKDNIKTVLEGSTLRIYYEGDKNWNSGRKKLKVYLSFKTISVLEASGASDILATGKLTMPSLTLNLSGASDFKGKVEIDNLQMELSGASDVRISGTAGTVSIESSGASDVKGYDLVADVCSAKASGASDINITVNKQLSAHASGASDIFYKGSALIKDVHSSGASTIARRD
jgi:hypothetical protein